MNARNQEYADLWARLEANQAQRRKSADCEKAITIISAQRERDFAERITDPEALLRMYGIGTPGSAPARRSSYTTRTIRSCRRRRSLRSAGSSAFRTSLRA